MKTIILGAGASYPFGYPLGTQLIDKIISRIPGNSENLKYTGSGWDLSRLPQPNFEGQVLNRYYILLREILKFYDPLSIDNFLNQQAHNLPDIVEPGKVMICYEILRAEDKKIFSKGGSVFDDRRPIYHYGNWLNLIFNSMLKNKSPREWLSEDLPFYFVTFNYDVSLEYFFWSRIMRSGFFAKEEKNEAITKILSNIRHVYGSVRNVGAAKYDDLIGYGELSNSGVSALSLARENYKNILLIEERKDLACDDIKTKIHQSEELIFLGYGFAPENNEVLGITEYRSKFIESDERKRSLTVKYTNTADSLIIDGYIKSYFAPVSVSLKRMEPHIHSSRKGCYGAILSDFIV